VSRLTAAMLAASALALTGQMMSTQPSTQTQQPAEVRQAQPNQQAQPNSSQPAPAKPAPIKNDVVVTTRLRERRRKNSPHPATLSNAKRRNLSPLGG
jgi:hypothetical protein